LLPLSIFLIFSKRNKNIQARVIFFYCLSSLISDFLINSSSDRSIFLILSVYTVVEYSFFSAFLYTVLENSKIKKTLIAISIIFIISCIFIFFNFRNTRFDSLPASLEAIVIITFTIYYLYEQNNKPQITFIYLSYTFWIIFAFLIYLSGTFFLFIKSSNLPDETRNSFWSINLVCNVLKNILFAVAFFMRKNNSKPDSLTNFGG